MNDVDLPELPKPTSDLYEWGGRPEAPERRYYYTADQMREFARLAVLQERERAAKVCEAVGASYDNEWNRKLGVANDLKDIADECAECIRAGHSVTETKRD